MPDDLKHRRPDVAYVAMAPACGRKVVGSTPTIRIMNTNINSTRMPGRGVKPWAVQVKRPDLDNPKPSTPRGKRRREAKN